MEHLRLMRAAPEETPDGPLVFMASTPGTKRDGLDTAALPWRVDNYRLNPVVTWVHDFGGSRLPIGRGDVEVLNTPAGEFVRAAITFDRADPFASEVERKYKDGFLHAVSVSWDDVDAAGAPVRAAGGRAVAHELLEIAAVPVPGDPAALLEKRATVLRSMARDLIDAIAATEDETEATTTDGVDADAEEATDEVTSTDDGETDEGEADGAGEDSEDEDTGDAVAAEMVALFDPESDDSDEARARRYRSLLPAYRRLGWTAPELLPASDLAALDGDVWRGLFVSGELARLERVGKEISAANLAGLKDALAQIEAGTDALRTMVKRVDSGADRAAADEPTAEDIARAVLESMTARITTN